MDSCLIATPDPFPLDVCLSVGAVVLAEPVLQRGLSEGPLQIPVEPAAGQQIPDPLVPGRQAGPRGQGASANKRRKARLKCSLLADFTFDFPEMVYFFSNHSATGSCQKTFH